MTEGEMQREKLTDTQQDRLKGVNIEEIKARAAARRQADAAKAEADAKARASLSADAQEKARLLELEKQGAGALAKRVSSLEKDYEVAKADVKSKGEKLAQAEAQGTRLSGDLQALRGRYDGAQSSVSALETELEGLRALQGEVGTKLEQREQEYQALQQRLGVMEKQVGRYEVDLKKQRDSLDAKAALYTKDTGDLRRQIGGLQEEKTALGVRLEEAAAGTELLEERLQAATAQYDAKTQALAAAEADYAKLEGQYHAKEAEVTKAGQDYAKLDVKARTQEARIAELEAQAIARDRQYSADAESWGKKKDELSAALNDALDQRDALVVELEGMIAPEYKGGPAPDAKKSK